MITAEKSRNALWGPQRRTFTAGLVLVITLVAFEAMGLGTALPTIVAELQAQHWYAWPFTVFMAASAVGTVLGGRQCDRRGPALPLLVALQTFAAGLLVATAATNILVLLVARVLQGLGGGALIVSLYVMIARVYPEEHRPAAFGVLSSAWVVPALVGPVIAGFLTEQVSWRWVFLGLAPLVVVGTAMIAPTVRRLGAGVGEPSPQRPGVLVAAVGAAGGVVAVNWAAQTPSLPSLFLGIAAVAVLVPSMRVLLPKGTLLARPGLPVMVLARGLLAGLFFTAQAFVPLVLTLVHHYSPTAAGVPLTVGTLGWTAGALWQGRQRDVRREHVVAAGFLLLAVGMAGLALTTPSWGPHWLVFAFWFTAGSGMGVGIASTSVRVLALSPEGERGFNSAALQIADMLGQAALVGLGGVVVSALATAAAPTRGVVPLDLALLVAALLAAALMVRAGRHQPR
ncbi:MFS transporter [Saccharopolyspora subtropica]|uniref:MFS transporter n=1 Tax=Saccharopolyspora thermophila TaxID=89367 RepID=A0A917N926_9PSEU|nr:MFS transporter [Saccharopolyspora subtropica]GGI73036.1 MFS transporter [Saccharopolyspora subtropica]